MAWFDESVPASCMTKGEKRLNVHHQKRARYLLDSKPFKIKTLKIPIL
jgi:hypothetical protein